jgi:hypothetical protein
MVIPFGRAIAHLLSFRGSMVPAKSDDYGDYAIKAEDERRDENVGQNKSDVNSPNDLLECLSKRIPGKVYLSLVSFTYGKSPVRAWIFSYAIKKPRSMFHDMSFPPNSDRTAALVEVSTSPSFSSKPIVKVTKLEPHSHNTHMPPLGSLPAKDSTHRRPLRPSLTISRGSTVIQ